MSKLYVINNAKQKEPFSWKKVYVSARRVGAPKPLARDIATLVEDKAYPGISTKEIFRTIKQVLRKELPFAGIRFNLKAGIRKLGPSGFPFEKYAGEIFKQQGYFLTYNQFLKGRCIEHETDFVAKKKNKLLLAECKYHHLPGNRVDARVVEYTYAAFLDIKDGNFLRKEEKQGVTPQPLIVTNTKFTSQAIKYARCVKVNLLGWRYPKDKGLEYWVESQKMYPITILPSFKRSLVDTFTRERIMLAKDLLSLDPFKFARKVGLPQKDIVALVREAKILFQEE